LILSQSGRPLGDVLTTDLVAIEVVRTLVGSIGLIAAVPLTTALAARVVSDTSPFKSWSERHQPPEPEGELAPAQAWGVDVDEDGWPIAREGLDL